MPFLRCFALLSAAFSVSAVFATGPFLSTGTYRSTGDWKSSDSTSGTYSDEFQVTSVRGGYSVKVTAKITSSGSTRPTVRVLEWTALETGDGFFDVEMGGKTTGWGHCTSYTCHIQSEGTGTGDRWGETLQFGTFSSTRAGWEETSGVRTIWKGSIR